MKQLASLLRWTLKAALFFTLFAFALNNQHDSTVHFFFGYQWTSPLVMVVLISFAGGLLLGILGMVPRWWQQRREARRNAKLSKAPIAQATPAADDTLTHGL